MRPLAVLFSRDSAPLQAANDRVVANVRAGRLRLFDRILDAVRGVPGVAHAGGSIWTPVDGGMRMGDSQNRIAFNFVTAGWFAAYGTALRAGRDFTVRDTAGSPPVVIVNDAFVRIHGGHVAGRRSDPAPPFQPEVLRTVVGLSTTQCLIRSGRESSRLSGHRST
jgi:hypothetical protein